MCGHKSMYQTSLTYYNLLIRGENIINLSWRHKIVTCAVKWLPTLSCSSTHSVLARIHENKPPALSDIPTSHYSYTGWSGKSQRKPGRWISAHRENRLHGTMITLSLPLTGPLYLVSYIITHYRVTQMISTIICTVYCF